MQECGKKAIHDDCFDCDNIDKCECGAEIINEYGWQNAEIPQMPEIVEAKQLADDLFSTFGRVFNPNPKRHVYEVIADVRRPANSNLHPVFQDIFKQLNINHSQQ
jgi:hypothetical protein